jgi:inner membrane protein COX18
MAAAALGTQLDTTADSTLPAILAANESILNTMHGAGLPWWGTIVTSTLLLRTSLTLPIAIYQQRSLGRMLQLAPMVQSWQTTLNSKILNEAKEKGWSHKEYNTELQKQVWKGE